MYAETDFILALIKEDDWLSEAAENVFENHEDELWTSPYTLVELMLVAYREGWNVLRVVAAGKELVEVRGDTDDILAAASYVEDDGFTPLDAVHLVSSGDDTVVSSDSDYDGFTERVRLEEMDDTSEYGNEL
ncbi:MAG: PIN domain-containing protein [Halobacteriales archaeon]|nr:PIN domain-containing protein [Halobacteriales archaeon]